jgi:acyl carrier protein
MNPDPLQTLILDVLGDIAPEADLARIDPKVSFHDQFDIDSVDFLNIMMTLEARIGVAIPEADYPKLSSLEGCVGYLRPKLQESAQGMPAGLS